MVKILYSYFDPQIQAQEAIKQGQRAYVGKVNMDSNVVAKYYEEESVSQSIKVNTQTYRWILYLLIDLSVNLALFSVAANQRRE